jgi:hypothetical protein
MVNGKIATSCGREEAVPETESVKQLLGRLKRGLPVEQGFLPTRADAGPSKLHRGDR